MSISPQKWGNPQPTTGKTNQKVAKLKLAKKSAQYDASLKHVFGLTLESNCSFSCDPNSGLLAYPAGNVIVLHNPRSNTQSHIFNPGQKTLTCLRFSSDGNYIVTGEAGYKPCVRVFSVSDRCQLKSFLSHNFAISCVDFSPNGKYVVSIGNQFDKTVNLWDWEKGILAASNNELAVVKGIAFSEDNNYFVSVGVRHVKFWYLESSPAKLTAIPLKGKLATLDNLRTRTFCDVICGVGDKSQFTYAVSRGGILCQLNAKRKVEKYVKLKSGNARTITVMDEMILCGCASGSVHVFNATSLEFISEVFSPSQDQNAQLVAMAIDVRNIWMHYVFSDHSLIVYDITEFDSPRIHSLSSFHSSCVLDMKVVPSTSDCDSLPKNCFLTCSNDGTARAWQCIENECNLFKVIKLDSSDGRSDETSVKYEARSLCIRYDAKHLAVGDSAGNIHIYNLETFEKLAFIPTNKGSILCMDYSPSGNCLTLGNSKASVLLFDHEYTQTQTISKHNSAVTSVKFALHENKLCLMTCGKDKALYFNLINENGEKNKTNQGKYIAQQFSMSDMAVIDDSVLVACGLNIMEYDVPGGTLRRSFCGSESGSTILRVAVNSHKTLVATSCTDKHINILGYSSTQCLCIMEGHSLGAPALAFDLEDRLLSGSSDSCVFVWNLKSPAQNNKHRLLFNNFVSSGASTPRGSELDLSSNVGSESQALPSNEGIRNDEEMDGETQPSLVLTDVNPENDDFEKPGAASGHLNIAGAGSPASPDDKNQPLISEKKDDDADVFLNNEVALDEVDAEPLSTSEDESARKVDKSAFENEEAGKSSLVPSEGEVTKEEVNDDPRAITEDEFEDESGDETASMIEENLYECEKIGESLLALFEHAEALYHEQKAIQDRRGAEVASSSSSSSSSSNGFQKLTETFQIMNDRINCLESFNPVTPAPTSSSEVNQIDNISDDSPVYNLLREYTNKLVDLVQPKTT